MEQICEKENCCGCGTCVEVCPRNAIVMERDYQGFLRPNIDLALCINCTLCEQACPVNYEFSFQNKKNIETYAAKAKEWFVRSESQSGGAFYIFARDIIKRGGIVYGASHDGVKILYERVEELKSLAKLRKSKYVQAELKGMHKQVESDLKNGKEVLFSGTPCYVASLISYLSLKKANTDNLITMDLICYGVPSPGIYEEYLEIESKKAGREISEFVFRDKKWSLNEKYSRIIWKDEKCEEDMLVNGYLRLFSSKMATRKSCTVCRFAQEKRISDITIGDYWGIESLKPEFDDNKGVSVVVVHTTKGSEFFRKVEKDFSLYKTSFEDAQRKQPAMTAPLGEIRNQGKFWEDYKKYGLEHAMIQYTDYDTSCHVKVQGKKILTKDKKFLYSHIRGRLKTALPNKLRPFVRKLFGR